jgi:hypothetical protein
MQAARGQIWRRQVLVGLELEVIPLDARCERVRRRPVALEALEAHPNANRGAAQRERRCLSGGSLQDRLVNGRVAHARLAKVEVMQDAHAQRAHLEQSELPQSAQRLSRSGRGGGGRRTRLPLALVLGRAVTAPKRALALGTLIVRRRSRRELKRRREQLCVRIEPRAGATVHMRRRRARACGGRLGHGRGYGFGAWRDHSAPCDHRVNGRRVTEGVTVRAWWRARPVRVLRGRGHL